MVAYLLDSNHASPLVTLSHPLRQVILAEINRGHTFAISIPVLTETLFGLYTLPRAEQNVAEWSHLRRTISCYQLDEADAVAAAQLQARLRKRGRQLGMADAMIATTALRYNLVLLTTDQDFSAVPDLKCENWLASLSIS